MWVVADSQRQFSKVCRRGGWDESAIGWLRKEDDQSGLWFEDILGSRYTNRYRMDTYRAAFIDGVAGASRWEKFSYPLSDFSINRGQQGELVLFFDNRVVEVGLFFKTPDLNMSVLPIGNDWLILQGEDVRIKYTNVAGFWLEYPTPSPMWDTRTTDSESIEYTLKHRELIP